MFSLTIFIVVLSVSLAAAGCGDKSRAVSEQKAQNKVEKPHEEKADDAKHGDKHEEKKEEAIVLTPEAVKNVSLATTPVTFRPVREKISATATIAHNQDRLFHVTPRIDGRVLELYVSVGSSVSKGQKLALLDSTTMGETKSEYLKSKTLVELAKANYEREKSLFDQKIAAKKDVLTAEAEYRKAEAELRSLEEKLKLYGLSRDNLSNLETASSQFVITAPGGGVVIEKDISQGEVVQSGKKILTISDLSTVWIVVDVYDRDLTKVRKGTEVTLSVDAYNENTFRGAVDYISDVVNPESRTVQVRVKVPNPNRQLKPGMFAAATFEAPGSDSTKKAAYIPSTAVFDIKGKKVVFVEESSGRFHPKDVEVASVTGNQVEITKGLNEGDKVVTNGGIYLKSSLLKEELGHGH
jgi:cobalt-zinc-cadmium efflux system membrane fusion protein